MKQRWISHLTDADRERIKSLEEELGVELVPFSKQEKDRQVNFYDLLDEDPL